PAVIAAPKDLQTPLPAAPFGPGSPPGGFASYPAEPPALNRGSLPDGSPDAAPAVAMTQWRCGLDVVGGALLLYTPRRILAFAIYTWRSTYSLSSTPAEWFIDLALGGLAGCGLVWALQDRKIAVSVLAGGVLLRSLVRLMPTGVLFGSGFP